MQGGRSQVVAMPFALTLPNRCRMVRAHSGRRRPGLNYDLLLPLAALPFPKIDPVIVQIGPLAIHWYGLGYIVGILFAWWYARRLIANRGCGRPGKAG